jgi:hypothetical protein
MCPARAALTRAAALILRGVSKSNAEVDFEISDEDMETLKSVEPLEDYGEASAMPVFGGTL